MKHSSEHQIENAEIQQSISEASVKAPYETPRLVIHGKVEKLTLQTGGGIPGGGGTGPGGSTVF